MAVYLTLAGGGGTNGCVTLTTSPFTAEGACCVLLCTTHVGLPENCSCGG